MKDKLTQISDDLNHDIITEKEAKRQLLFLCGVSTRTFRFSGMKHGKKFIREIQAKDRESAIADFELTYPDLTWRFSTDIT
tara:strand:+ start:2886 stop:3128 length:243 start_codon:yes stop_codon:yes gene_type:complete